MIARIDKAGRYGFYDRPEELVDILLIDRSIPIDRPSRARELSEGEQIQQAAEHSMDDCEKVVCTK